MTLTRALVAWCFLFGIAFANGAFREFVYRKYLGEWRANQVSCGLGIVLITGAVWAVSRWWPFASSLQAWRTGCLWLGLTVAWEFVFGHFIMGHPWQRLLGDYAFWRGRLWPLVLAAILVAPALVYSWARK